MFLQIINAFVFERITPTLYTPQCKIPMASSRILEWGRFLVLKLWFALKKHQIHFNSIKLYEIFSVISAKVKLSKNIPWTLTTTQDLTYTKSIPCFIFFYLFLSTITLVLTHLQWFKISIKLPFTHLLSDSNTCIFHKMESLNLCCFLFKHLFPNPLPCNNGIRTSESM